MEFNLSAVENSIANTAKCMQGSLAEEYKNRALKLIKDLKGKNNEEIYTGIEDREETLHKLFGMRQSPAMAQ